MGGTTTDNTLAYALVLTPTRFSIWPNAATTASPITGTGSYTSGGLVSQAWDISGWSDDWTLLSDEGENKSDAGTRDLQLGRFLTSEFHRRYPGPLKGDSFVFVGDDGALLPDDRDLLREYFWLVIKRLGLHYQGFGSHAFRRESVTMRQQAGSTPMEAMKQAGHSTLDMTALYTLSDPAREREQVGAMFVWLTSSPSGARQ